MCLRRRQRTDSATSHCADIAANDAIVMDDQPSFRSTDSSEDQPRIVGRADKLIYDDLIRILVNILQMDPCRVVLFRQQTVPDLDDRPFSPDHHFGPPGRVDVISRRGEQAEPAGLHNILAGQGSPAGCWAR